MKKKIIVALIAAVLFAIVCANAFAGYGNCDKCSCSSFYSKTSGTTCDKCNHSFYDHKR